MRKITLLSFHLALVQILLIGCGANGADGIGHTVAEDPSVARATYQLAKTAVQEKAGDGYVFEYLDSMSQDQRTEAYNGKVKSSGTMDLQRYEMEVKASVDVDNFTTCGQEGRTGPSQTQCDTEYAGTQLEGLVTVADGIQQWTVPETALYRITALGAQGGGTNGGLGAKIEGLFELTVGTVLKILVGQQGTELLSSRYDFSGGGGSFVTDSSDNPIIIAGGGGGAEISGIGSNGQSENNGADGTSGYYLGTGGVDGGGGDTGTNTTDGGAGLLGNGESGNPNPAPQAFINGGEGGCNTWSTGCGAEGGFGGGGASNRNVVTNHGAGGGGGYSGGGSAYGQLSSGLPIAGGGGSYNSGINQVNTDGANSGHGKILVTKLVSCTLVTPQLISVSDFNCGSEEKVFSWTSTKVLEYDLIINGVRVETNLHITSAPLSETFIYESSNTWQVAARDCYGNEALSDVETFNVSASTPVAPTLTSQSDFVCDSGEKTFFWSGGTAESYDFILNDQRIKTDIIDEGVTLPIETLYQSTNTWQVAAKNCAGEEALSATDGFNVTSSVAPVQLTLVSPENNDELYCNATFSWDANGNSEFISYNLIIYNVEDLTTPIRQINTAGTSYTLSGDERLPSGIYRWKIAARNCGETNTVTSITRQFIVENTPPSPVLSTPAVDEWAPAITTFSWTNMGAQGDVTYTVYVDGTAQVSGISVLTYTLPEADALSHGEHDWYVEAKGCMDMTAVSGSPRDFRVDTEPPSEFDLVAPDETTWFNTQEVTFQWTESTETSEEGVGLESCKVVIDGTEVAYVAAPETSWGNGSTFVPKVSYFYGFETDTAGWTFSGSYNRWGRSTDYARTGSYSLSDSPSGNYANDARSYAYLQGTYVISSQTSIIYYIRGYAENYDDYLYFQIRPLGGSWTTLKAHTGAKTSWTAITPELSSYIGQTAEFRFYFYGDSTYIYDGYYIDDFKIIESEASGIPPIDFSDGPHDWFVTCRDKFGNSRDSNTHFTFHIDKTAPTAATLTEPFNNAVTNNSKPIFTWSTATDATSDIAGFEVWIDDIKVSGDDLLSSETLSWTPETDIIDGTHTWKVVAQDLAGNRTVSSEWNLRIDTTAPTAPTITNPPSYPPNYYSNWNVCWSGAADSGAGICNYAIYFDGSVAIETIDPSTFTGCQDYDIVADGVHTTYIVTTDCAGNTSPSEAVTFMLETMPPSLFTATEPQNGATINTLNPLFCWNKAVDSGTGIDYYDLYVDGVFNKQVSGISPDDVVCSRPAAELTNGNHTWKITAYDFAGNSKNATGMPWGVTVDQDIYPPTSTITTPEEGSLAGYINFEFTGTAEDIGPGGKRGSGISKVEVQLDSPTGSWITAELTGTDYNQTWRYIWNGTLGSHTLYVRATDNEGNVQETPVSRSFDVDSTLPSKPVITTPSNGSWISSVKPLITWNASTNNFSGICKYLLTIDSSEIELASDVLSYTPSSNLSEGEHTITLTAENCATNQSDTTQITVGIDITPPDTPVAVNPAENSCLNSKLPLFEWQTVSDSYSGVASISLFIDEALFKDGIASDETTFIPTTEIAEGTHNWQIKAIDKAGNFVSSSLIPFDVDLTIPTCEIKKIEEKTGESNFYIVSGVADGMDACGLSKVEIKINDGEWKETTPDSETGWLDWAYELNGTEQGNYTVKCRSLDNAGNNSTIYEVSADLDTCHELSDCDNVTKVCSTVLEDNTPCDDNNLCTQAETCKSGVCSSSDLVICSALDQCHNVGTCNPETGVCSNPEKKNGAVCDDANLCTYSDTCLLGNCTGTLYACDAPGTCETSSEAVCNGDGTCTYIAASVGTPCGDQTTTVCSFPDTCDGNRNCLSNHEPASKICRELAGDCDIAETCDGNRTCPTDTFKSSTEVCKASVGICDSEERCTGSSASCPNDFKLTTVCRNAAGECDISEICNGISDVCPENEYLKDGTTCSGEEYEWTTYQCVSGTCEQGEELNGGCDNAISITEYPFEDMGDITGRADHISSYGENCSEIKGSGSDVIYEFTVTSGKVYTVNISANFDTALAIIEVCGEDESCMYVSDTTTNEMEKIIFTATSDDTLILVVESVSGDGVYTLTIKETEKEESEDEMEHPDQDTGDTGDTGNTGDTDNTGDTADVENTGDHESSDTDTEFTEEKNKSGGCSVTIL